MNMDHLNFVVEALYYGYWIALVFAIICLLMFVYVKILDAKEQKKRLNDERKRINSDAILTKELVRKLSGFFMLEENCRGYDPNTPIGEIAKHAFLHWQRVDETERYAAQLEDKNKKLHSENFDLSLSASYLKDLSVQLKTKNECKDAEIRMLRRTLWLAMGAIAERDAYKYSGSVVTDNLKKSKRKYRQAKLFRAYADKFKE